MAEYLSPKDLTYSDRFSSLEGSRVEELKSSLKVKELHLARSQEKNALLISKLEEVQDEVERSHSQISTQAKLISELKEAIQHIKQPAAPPEPEQTTYSLIVTKNRLQAELAELREILRCKDKAIETLTEQLHFYQEKLEAMEQELEAKCNELGGLQKRIIDTEKNIDRLYLYSPTESEILLQLEYYKSDNSRLYELLEHTAEYKEFVNILKDSGPVHYAPSKRREKERVKMNEIENWVPEETLRVTHEYKKKGNLNEEMINALVEDINNIWKEREKNLLSKIKTQSQNEVLNLKRQLFMRKSYDNVQSQKQISRLKSELKKANTSIGAKIRKDSSEPRALSNPENTIRLLTEVQKENSNLSAENSRLKKELHSIKRQASDASLISDATNFSKEVLKESRRLHNMLNQMFTKIEHEPASADYKKKQEHILVTFIIERA